MKKVFLCSTILIFCFVATIASAIAPSDIFWPISGETRYKDNEKIFFACSYWAPKGTNGKVCLFGSMSISTGEKLCQYIPQRVADSTGGQLYFPPFVEKPGKYQYKVYLFLSIGTFVSNTVKITVEKHTDNPAIGDERIYQDPEGDWRLRVCNKEDDGTLVWGVPMLTTTLSPALAPSLNKIPLGKLPSTWGSIKSGGGR